MLSSLPSSRSLSPPLVPHLYSADVSPVRNHQDINHCHREKVTIGEIATQLINVSSPRDEKQLNAYLQGGGAIYPNIVIPKNLFAHRRHTSSMMMVTRKERIDDPNDAMNNENDDISENDDIDDDDNMSTHDNVDDGDYEREEAGGGAASWISSAKDTLERCALHVPPLQLMFSARNVELDEKRRLLDATLQNPVRAFDWHNTLFRFAVALQDRCIYFYDLEKEEWSSQVIRHDFHRDVRVIRYKPYPESSTTLAVGCRHGICLWELNQRLTMFSKQNFQTKGRRDETQNGVCIFLQTNSPVTSLEWFPQTSTSNTQLKFVSASEFDHRVTVWEYSNENQKWFHRYITRMNGGIRNLAFSPNGRYLAVFTNSNVFRIWDTSTWTTEKWSSFTAPVQAFAWSANSRYLLISTLNSHLVHVLEFDKKPPLIGGEYKFEIDLSQHPYFADNDDMAELPKIKSLALDHAGGQRIVISFENNDRLAVLRCDFEFYSPESTILPISSYDSVIYGPRDGKAAHHLQFWNNFKKGSLLSCCWNNGKVSLIPFYYLPDTLEW